MSLKWKEISQLLEEARPALLGSSLQKVAQLREVAAGESFLFQGFGERGPWRLWCSLLQDHSCWVFAGEDWALESQPEPSTFVMVMRKRLLGKRVIGLEQVRHERFLLLHFEEDLSLLFELLPKRANLMLVEAWNREERTARCVHSFRQVSLESGGLYRLPPPPAAPSAEEVRALGQEAGGPYPFHGAVARKYWDSVQRTGFTAYKRLWRQGWKSFAKKLNTALENSRRDLEESREAELFHRRGMALVSNLYALGAQEFPKQKKIELDGLEIPLDVSKNFADNAETYFRKSKKLHRAVQELEGRVAALEARVHAAAAVTEKIEQAPDEEALEALASAFEREGLEVPERPSGVEEKEGPAVKPFLEVESSDGFQILCGRNQEENRRVTFRESKGNDLWLHVKGVPGAHVVVKEQKKKTVPLATLLEAAQLCLYYSRIRKGKRAEVDYTQRKHVRAIKGTLAEVTYTGNKTLYVEADPDVLKRLMRGGG